jgi:hypothetical protein
MPARLEVEGGVPLRGSEQKLVALGACIERRP